eukprot:357076-Chlamydomonas_euryale.AAC.6
MNVLSDSLVYMRACMHACSHVWMLFRKHAGPACAQVPCGAAFATPLHQRCMHEVSPRQFKKLKRDEC